MNDKNCDLYNTEHCRPVFENEPVIVDGYVGNMLKHTNGVIKQRAGVMNTNDKNCDSTLNTTVVFFKINLPY